MAGYIGSKANVSQIDGYVKSEVDTLLGQELNLSGGSMTGHLNFGDNIKSQYGAGTDLQIYHDASHSYIKDAGTGNLRLSATTIELMKVDTSELMASFAQDGAVTLYYDNAVKLATATGGVDITGNIVVSGTVDGIDIAARDAVLTSTTTTAGAALPKAGGAMTGNITGLTALDVTGTVTADGLTVDGNATVQNTGDGFRTLALSGNRTGSGVTTARVSMQWDGNEIAKIQSHGGADTTNKDEGDLLFYTADAGSLKLRQLIDQNGDISFYEDTGSTAKFFWDASAESLTLSGTGGLDVTGTVTATELDINGVADVSATLTAGALSIPSQGMIFNQAFGTGVPTITMTGTANNGRGGAITFKESDGAGGSIADTAAIYSTDGAGGNATYGGLTIATYQGDMKLSTGGLASPRITILSGGNVGIGTSSPNAGLEVLKSGGGKIRISETAAKYVEIIGYAEGSANGSTMAFHTNQAGTSTSTERMRIDSSGNVGIGDTSPSDKLVVKGDAASIGVESADMQIALLGKRASSGVGLDQGYLRLRNQGVTNNGAVIDSAGSSFFNGGNVGIGIASPAERLHVEGSSPSIKIKANNEGGSAELKLQSDQGDDDQDLWSIKADPAHALDFINYVSGAWNTRMRIDSSGNVLVNTTDTDGDVGSSSFSGLSFSARVAYGLRVTTSESNYWNRIGDGSVHQFRRSGTTVGTIAVDSNSTAYNTSSDYRLKENVDYTWDATTRLKQLKPARFNFIVDDTNTLVDGFIAHEVSSIVPEAITGAKDAVDADNNPEYQGIDQSKLVPLLVKTIQELEARITILEA